MRICRSWPTTWRSPIRPTRWLADSLKGAETRDLEGGGWVWDWDKSTADLAPMAAVTGALWLLETQPSYDPLESIF